MTQSILKSRRNSVLLAWAAILLGFSVFCGTARILRAAPTPIPKTKPTPVPTPQPTPAPRPIPIPANVETFKVSVDAGDSATNAGEVPPIPAEVTFYLRRPARIVGKEPARVVFICPDETASGRMTISSNAFGTVADERGWFLLSASFLPEDALGGVNATGTTAASGTAAAAPNGGRSASGMVKPSPLPVNSIPTPIAPYADAARYSGKALQAALEQAKQKYSIATDALFLQGYGTGAQFVIRYALFNPQKVGAVAAHSANGFGETLSQDTGQAAALPWLITQISSDAVAQQCAEFTARLRQAGGKPIVRNYGEIARKIPGQIDSAEPDTLAQMFFRYRDEALRAKQALPALTFDESQGPSNEARLFPLLQPEAFIGDLRTLRYWKADSPESAQIPEDARVELPCRALANYWGVQIDKFIVKSASPLNPEIPFYVRIPANYNPNVRARVLFRCPVYNGIGIRCASGDGPFAQLADERGWFTISPTFKQAREDIKERAQSYYYPETFSGSATLEALDTIAKKYPIATNSLLMQGMSGGAQFVHRFAIWQPERVAAVAVNSSSWFDDPNPKSAQVAWLVTIGEADPSCENSVDFLDKLRANGALPLFRSYIGMVHEGSSKVDEFNIIFLKFYDDATRAKLAARPMAASFVRPAATPVLSDFAKKFQPKATPTPAFAPTSPLIPPASMPLVGDMKDWKIYKNEPQALQRISPDDMIYLPSPEIARMWSGKGIEEDGGQETGRNGAPY